MKIYICWGVNGEFLKLISAFDSMEKAEEWKKNDTVFRKEFRDKLEIQEVNVF